MARRFSNNDKDCEGGDTSVSSSCRETRARVEGMGVLSLYLVRRRRKVGSQQWKTEDTT